MRHWSVGVVEARYAIRKLHRRGFHGTRTEVDQANENHCHALSFNEMKVSNFMIENEKPLLE
jgi:uncharacterized protein (DUF111 family)